MKISLGTTYYNNPQNILKFISHHQDYVDELIIVDDGSDDIYHICNYVQPSEKIKIYRVKKDYGFNSHGCRNLIMKEVENDFVVLLDSDREFIDPEIAFATIRNKKLKFNVIYKFKAHNFEFGKGTHTSVNDFLISKDFFFSVGGYDEEWIGYRNGDRQFFKQLDHFGEEVLLDDVHLLLTRKASLRAQKIGEECAISKKDIHAISNRKKKIVQRRIECPEPNKKILTFEWEKITS